MSKPLDAYDLRDWKTDSLGCWNLAISELRKRGVMEGRFPPINEQEAAYHGIARACVPDGTGLENK